ncbi:ABC-2 transporter permease [Romboutsia weinsteinii]|uniref:ABC-2 transporter permease n=1 Tax=Romboutsia weinsteinii TaxID=2020949 RepID=A0A255IIF0_9FIRM|nr:ABC-2 transporter permease [Romboutsia weinsteinii]RDY27749.1 ABC-2 transporter permease [Romboutsia weinsteinii]
MKGLILKDFINIKKESKSFLLVFAMYFVLIGTQNLDFLIGVICLLCTMLPTITFTSDEKVEWDSYAISMPISRNDIVISKYALGIICSFIGYIISIILSFIVSGISVSSITIPTVIFAFSAIFLSVVIPISLIIGPEKGRLLLMILIITPSVLAGILANTGIVDVNKIEGLVNFVIKFGPILGILIAIVSFSISLCICLKIYKNKEF